MSPDAFQLEGPLKALCSLTSPFIAQGMGVELTVYRSTDVNISHLALDAEAFVLISKFSLINFTKA